MLRRPFIFWLYSCKVWLLTLILDSPICTWWLVELFITKTEIQPITRAVLLTAGDLNSIEIYVEVLKYLNKYCIIYPQLVEFELV